MIVASTSVASTQTGIGWMRPARTIAAAAIAHPPTNPQPDSITTAGGGVAGSTLPLAAASV